MKMPGFHAVAMWFFIAGFACANSGLAPTLSIIFSDRPDWSVCGEDLCLCVKPTPTTPSCPLCEYGEGEATCIGSEEQLPDTPPKRVPKNPHADAITQAGQIGSASAFIALVLGHARSQTRANESSVARFAEPDAHRSQNQPDIPAPPPRS
jgi:hypothetical protein